MEFVLFGKAARAGYSEAQRELLRKCKAEEWFAQPRQNIHYLFAETHSAAYPVSLAPLVWYILNYPETGAIVLGERSDYSVGG